MHWVVCAILAARLATAQTQRQTVPAAGDIPPRIAAFLEKCETSRRGAMLQLEHQLRGLRSQASASPADARRAAKIEADLRALRANEEPVVPALKFPPEVGDIGRLPRLTCHVDQILSKDEMLVRCLFSLKVRSVARYQAQQETIVRPQTFLMRGVPTRPDTAGSDLPLDGVFEISGTYTYQTVAGKSITVRVLKPFDMRAIEPYFRAMADRQKQPPD